MRSRHSRWPDMHKRHSRNMDRIKGLSFLGFRAQGWKLIKMTSVIPDLFRGSQVCPCFQDPPCGYASTRGFEYTIFIDPNQSFLGPLWFLLREYNIPPKKELHQSLEANPKPYLSDASCATQFFGYLYQGGSI